MMSEEDRLWLEEAMKAHTFNDTDRLGELIEQLKAWGTLNSQTSEESKEAAAM